MTNPTTLATVRALALPGTAVVFAGAVALSPARELDLDGFLAGEVLYVTGGYPAQGERLRVLLPTDDARALDLDHEVVEVPFDQIASVHPTMGEALAQAQRLNDENDLNALGLTPDEAAAHQAHYEQCEREERMAERTGHRLCSCGHYTLKVTTRPTRNYGGGWDTFSRCRFCGRVDVAV